MVNDASSISSLSSLDNVSRSNMLRRQREAALRRRQAPLPNAVSSGGSRPSSSHQMGSMTTSAMADVLAWEEAKTKERIDARIRQEEIQRIEEVNRMAEVAEAAERRAEMAKAAAEKAEAARREDMERFEREQKAREEVARKLEQEARRLAEAEAEAERLEKERLAEEAVKRAKLERLEKELICERLEKERLILAAKAKVEVERLAEQERPEKERHVVAIRPKVEVGHTRITEQQSLEHRFRAPLGDVNGVVVNNFNDHSSQRPYPMDNEYDDGNGTGMTRQLPPPQMKSGPMQICNEETHRQVPPEMMEETHMQVPPEMMGSSNGYQRYLSTYRQPVPVTEGSIRGESREDATVISELTEANISPTSTLYVQAEKNVAQTSTCAEPKGSDNNINRSISSRSLSFAEVSEADKLSRNQDSAEGMKQTSVAQSDSSKSSEEGERVIPKQEMSESTQGKMSSLGRIASIENINLDDPKAMRSFLMDPCPKGEGMIECCIKRSKGIKKALFPEYRMYLKTNNSKTETFLMTSKKRAGNKSSNYLISMNPNDHDKNSESIIGKLRSNFLGTEYMIYDHGRNPDYDETNEKNEAIRCELGAILYAATTTLGAKGPRKMKVCVSKVDDDGTPLKTWQPSGDEERMLTCFKKETFYIDKLLCLENKPPSWNDEVGAYVLNFHGRVTQASVKNFQLCEANGEQEQIMQFGRTGKDEFSMDVQWPMSLYQAFAVALSSFDSKLGCD